MTNTLQGLFKVSKREIRLLFIFLAFTLFCAALFFGRMQHSGHSTYRFLLWNLFLAWIPLGFAALANRFRPISRHLLLLLPCLASWLLFLPNAPYILTDLVHLRARSGVPLWFDILLILSFAVHGLLLGLASCHEVHQVLKRRMKPLFAWTLLVGAFIASAYGVYLGRFLRWNSWDILSQPEALLHDVLRPILHPFQNKEVIAMTLGFGVFMFLCYLAVQWISDNRSEREVI